MKRYCKPSSGSPLNVSGRFATGKICLPSIGSSSSFGSCIVFHERFFPAITCAGVRLPERDGGDKPTSQRTPINVDLDTFSDPKLLSRRQKLHACKHQHTTQPPLSPFSNPVVLLDRKSTRLNSSHSGESRMPSSA